METGMWRVGGLALTQRAIGLCGWAAGARLADIGCGQGATVRYLRGAGFAAGGLDIDPVALAQAGEYCQLGDALALPYAAGSLDGVLFECSLSPLEAKELALAEAGRVLKAGGRLIISDLYARAEKAPAGPLLSRARWLKLLEQAAFSVSLFEDRHDDLTEFSAQLVWEYGREGLQKLCGCAYDKAADLSYFLLVAAKGG